MKHPSIRPIVHFTALAALATLITGCGGSKPEGAATAPAAGDAKKQITVGFSQIGAESAWRTANTRVDQETRRRSAASS
jgi:hypothetical protein